MKDAASLHHSSCCAELESLTQSRAGLRRGSKEIQGFVERSISEVGSRVWDKEVAIEISVEHIDSPSEWRSAQEGWRWNYTEETFIQWLHQHGFPVIVWGILTNLFVSHILCNWIVWSDIQRCIQNLLLLNNKTLRSTASVFSHWVFSGTLVQK